jgi:hypothetical protein
MKLRQNNTLLIQAIEEYEVFLTSSNKKVNAADISGCCAIVTSLDKMVLIIATKKEESHLMKNLG